MKLRDQQFIYSPSDLSNHINCKHLTQLNKSTTKGEIEKPESYSNLSLQALIERGQSFEEEHLEKLKAEGLEILELEYAEPDAEKRTIQAMQKGVDVIFQACLKTESWSGYADFVKKVDKPSKLGDWSYEVWDTKLATNTKASTVLQIGLYTQRIAEIQELEPEFMGVIKPDGEEVFRYHDYAAYIRLSQRRLKAALEEDKDTYPEPVSHCDICDWWKHCNARRRKDDHLTFVAGMGKSQIAELRTKDIESLAQLAELSHPVPFTPTKGNIHTYNKLRNQARIQYDSRNQSHKPLTELLPLEPGQGLFLLPEPSEHDIFLDFEGARMVEPDGLEYLIGYYYKGEYTALWAKSEQEELAIYEQFIAWAHGLKQKHPELHIYHYAPYETSAFKRLMGKYARYENEVDELLRSETFVDLYRVLRQSFIASVERYSLKDLEPFFGFEREMDLRSVSRPKNTFEFLLEVKKPEEANDADLQIIEAYNKDDCHALIHLQKWLEGFREQLISDGNQIPRPEPKGGQANDNITAHQEQILPLFNALQENLPALKDERDRAQQAKYILSHFLDWYRREEKAMWWEYYRLQELELTDLLDERKAISFLEFTGNSFPHAQSIVFEYRFPPQEADIKEGYMVNQSGDTVGSVYHFDKEGGILQIKKSAQYQELPHPEAIIQLQRIKPTVKEESIIRLAEWVVANSMSTEIEGHSVARKLLQRFPPELEARGNQNYIDYAFEVLSNMEGDYLAIQGPPGAGKSYTGSHLIHRLVQEGKKVGITAMSHKVITNLLSSVHERFIETDEEVHIIQKGGDQESPWTTTNNNSAISTHLDQYHVIAGTSYMWAREELYQSVDYLFVDEAGQLALIDTVALAQATDNLVLLGDPNQLQQPQQGVHPADTQVSALEHVLNGQQTIPEDQGIFLGSTWRMHPSINEIVSELFYQNRLIAEEHLATQKIIGSDQFKEGLALMEVEHEGNTSSSAEEVQKVQELVNRLTQGNIRYIDGKGEEKILERSDIKIISPYNAQVNLLKEALPDLEIGTVDKFQGQEAPIVIYSVASSSPQEAPRGMDFLYSPNRLNVAISRAQALFIMIASPEIFEAECKSPKEMKLANAFCRFLESS